MHMMLCLGDNGKMIVKYINIKFFKKSVNSESEKNPHSCLIAIQGFQPHLELENTVNLSDEKIRD